jgi:adenine deaminase
METVIGRLEEIRRRRLCNRRRDHCRITCSLCGVVSLKPMEIVGEEVRKLEECLKKNGVEWEKPVLTVDTSWNPAIPSLRITHHGYVRLKDREILSLKHNS